MHIGIRLLFVALAIFAPQVAKAMARPARHAFDIVIYGSSPAAVTAAVQARRMGKTVVILAPETHIGGLTTGGLGATDIGHKGAIGGLARTFYERVAAHYARDEAWLHQPRAAYDVGRHGEAAQEDPIASRTGRPTMWTFEPHVAERIFEQMLAEAGVSFHREAHLDGVRKRGARIIELATTAGVRYRGKMYIDATYEGDLMAAAGVPYHVGREANRVYGETLNGVQVANALKHNFATAVDPYVVPGRPESGLLPGIQADAPGADGEGDHRVQAYNFRMTLTDAPANRLPIDKPPGYDPMRYELLRRYIDSGVFDALALNTPMPNRKTDINNRGAFSSDHIGANYTWAKADHTTRAALYQDHKNYVMGLWYFLQNDPRLPAKVRAQASRWGLCKDEFADNGHWPYALYVREARRMVSEYVMTEHECRGTRVAPASVGLAAYGMDSHNVQRYVRDGRVYNEGDVQVKVAGPYPIAYKSIIPRGREASNLLVPVAVSASHIAFGSIRMEPVFMVLGQSAATAASLALERRTSLHSLPYQALRARLLADGQVLTP